MACNVFGGTLNPTRSIVYSSFLSPVSIQTQSFALRAFRKRKPQETQALALASSQSWLPLLRPSIPIGWRTHAMQTIAFKWKPGFVTVFITHADFGSRRG